MAKLTKKELALQQKKRDLRKVAEQKKATNAKLSEPKAAEPVKAYAVECTNEETTVSAGQLLQGISLKAHIPITLTGNDLLKFISYGILNRDEIRGMLDLPPLGVSSDEPSNDESLNIEAENVTFEQPVEEKKDGEVNIVSGTVTSIGDFFKHEDKSEGIKEDNITCGN